MAQIPKELLLWPRGVPSLGTGERPGAARVQPLIHLEGVAEAVVEAVRT